MLSARAAIVAAAIRRKATTRGLDQSARRNAHACSDDLLAKAALLDYPLPVEGWPIATGVIEGSCRYVVKDRMDITGARWGLEGAEAGSATGQRLLERLLVRPPGPETQRDP